MQEKPSLLFWFLDEVEMILLLKRKKKDITQSVYLHKLLILRVKSWWANLTFHIKVPSTWN